jgi:predicted RNase H-like nuclease (RuvC/YqgF family)
VSSNGDSAGPPDRAALRTLERVVGQGVKELTALRRRANTAEQKSDELELLVRRFTKDSSSPVQMLSRIEQLESENADLRMRVDKGREGVERLLAKIRFLEEQR